MAENVEFRKALKHGAKLRLAICGPSGSGKTYTLLRFATELGGPIAVVDTERGSASKYADIFDFDVLELDAYDPRRLVQMIDTAAQRGYQVLCIDSLSHFWMGKDGELDQVDRIARRMQGNGNFAAWKLVTPVHNQLVDRIIGAPMHVLVSLRAKTEWVLERDEKTGKTASRKVGLAPVMREGIEYEFDVCGEMDQENSLVITKSRCPKLTGGVFIQPGKEVADILKEWLEGPPAPALRPTVSPTSAPNRSDGNHVGLGPLNETGNVNGRVPPGLETIWRRMCTPRSVVTEFAKLKEAITQAGGTEGESAYQEILKRHSVERPSEFKRSQQARFCAKELFQAIERFREISQAAHGAAKANKTGAAAAEGLAEIAVSGGQHGD